MPDKKKGQELAIVSLLEDDAFRIVSQIGYLRDDVIGYTVVKKCLEKQFAPPGVKFEWQRKLYMAQQKSAESLTEFAARLRMLADRAFLHGNRKTGWKWHAVTNLLMVSFLPQYTAEVVAKAAADFGRCCHAGQRPPS